jgi:hypothetical protein
MNTQERCIVSRAIYDAYYQDKEAAKEWRLIYLSEARYGKWEFYKKSREYARSYIARAREKKALWRKVSNNRFDLVEVS